LNLNLIPVSNKTVHYISSYYVFSSPFNSRRILAMLLVAVLALVQAKIAFAGCMTSDSGTPMVTAMEDCERCDTGNANDSYDSLSRICGNHCLQSATPVEKNSIQPDLPTATVASVLFTTRAPPPAPLHASPPAPGKTLLIYRLQRLLI
jgi:hypothetical protein